MADRGDVEGQEHAQEKLERENRHEGADTDQHEAVDAVTGGNARLVHALLYAVAAIVPPRIEGSHES